MRTRSIDPNTMLVLLTAEAIEQQTDYFGKHEPATCTECGDYEEHCVCSIENAASC